MAKLAMVKSYNGASSSIVALVVAPSNVQGKVYCEKSINAHAFKFASGLLADVASSP